MTYKHKGQRLHDSFTEREKGILQRLSSGLSDQQIATVCAQLGEAAFAEAWAEGCEMTLEEAFEDILRE